MRASACARAAGADTTETFIKVAEAYATLSNEKTRAAYDATRRARASSSFSSSSSSSSSSGPGYTFRFSLADAFDVLERFLRSHAALAPLAGGYALARARLERWPGFHVPLPELLAGERATLHDAIGLVDWPALARQARRALAGTFEKDDGSLDWTKVAKATGAGVTAIAAALDAADDGNRTRTLVSWGGALLSTLRRFSARDGAAGERARAEDEREARRERADGDGDGQRQGGSRWSRAGGAGGPDEL